MKKVLAAVALAAVATTSAYAQTATPGTATRQLTTASTGVIAIKSPIIMLAKCTVKGNITFAGSHMAVNFDTAKGDSCANIEVHALYEVPSPTPTGGGFSVPTYKDAATPVKATGDIMTKKCSYLFPNTVTAGKSIKISGTYKGGLASQANLAGGETSMFATVAGQTYSKDFVITFTIIT